MCQLEGGITRNDLSHICSGTVKHPVGELHLLRIPGQVFHGTGLDQTHILLPAVEFGISVQDRAGNGVEDVGDSIEVRCECARPSRLLCGDGHR